MATMRYPPGHKAETRARITRAAARVFRREGFSAGGVDAVMAEAGLTAGGFYAHFESKDQLFGESLASALRQVRRWHHQWGEGHDGFDRVRAVMSRYLSTAHCDEMAQGCPLPALLPEIARASAPVQARFRDESSAWLDEIVACMKPRRPGDRDLAATWIAFASGALQLARTQPNRRRASRILRQARGQLEVLITAREGDCEQ